MKIQQWLSSLPISGDSCWTVCLLYLVILEYILSRRAFCRVAKSTYLHSLKASEIASILRWLKSRKRINFEFLYRLDSFARWCYGVGWVWTSFWCRVIEASNKYWLLFRFHDSHPYCRVGFGDHAVYFDRVHQWIDIIHRHRLEPDCYNNGL